MMNRHLHSLLLVLFAVAVNVNAQTVEDSKSNSTTSWPDATESVDYVSVTTASMVYEDAAWLMPDGVFYQQKALPHGPSRTVGTVYSCTLAPADLEKLRELVRSGIAFAAQQDPQYNGMTDLGIAILFVHTKSGLQKSKFIYGGTDNATYNALIDGFNKVKCKDHLIIKGDVPLHWRPKHFPEDRSFFENQ